MALICRFYLFESRKILMLRIPHGRVRLHKHNNFFFRFFIAFVSLSFWLIKSNESNEI